MRKIPPSIVIERKFPGGGVPWLLGILLKVEVRSDVPASEGAVRGDGVSSSSPEDAIEARPPAAAFDKLLEDEAVVVPGFQTLDQIGLDPEGRQCLRVVHDVSLPELLLDDSNSAERKRLLVSLGVRICGRGGQEPAHDFRDPALGGVKVGDRLLDVTMAPVIQMSDGAMVHHNCVRNQDIEMLTLDEKFIEGIAREEGSWER
jgi:hypothetical protein